MNVFMKNFGKKLALGAALSASVLMATSPAQARDRYYDRGNDAAVAIGAGVIGLAIGAALADRSDRYYYDRDYYHMRRYVRFDDRPGYYYYYDGYPNRYYNDRYYDRYYAPYYRERYRGGNWGRGGDWNRGGNWNRGNAWGRDNHWNNGARRGDFRNYGGGRGGPGHGRR